MHILIMCIGNIDGGDDAAGPYIAKKIDKEKGKIDVIDCGTIPENYTSIVKKKNPEKLIIIDAVDMNLEAGEIRIIPKDSIGQMHISTHGIPISVLIGYLEQYIKDIIIVGIQPKTMIGKMTDNVKASCDFLIKKIKIDEIDDIKKLK